MTLDDWLALPPDTRRERQKNWTNIAPVGEEQPLIDTEWTTVIDEAAKRFRRQFGKLNDVLCISPSCGFHAEHPICIWVTTRLLRGQTLSELPLEYATFPVKQEPLGDEIQAFKDTWSAVLSRLFDWDPLSIAELVAEQEWV
jgi:hypothetical protein